MGKIVAGAYKVEITPFDLKNARLAGFGFNRVAEGVLDPLYARVLYLSDGTEEVVLVGLDLIGLLNDEVRAIRRKVRGIPQERINLCCTHVHSGPDTIGLWGRALADVVPLVSGVDSRYMDWMMDEVAFGIMKAKKLAVPVREISLALDERGKQDLVRNVRQPEYNDESLLVLRLTDRSGKTIAALINYAAHPECLWDKNRLVSADYVGHALGELERAVGGTGIFLSGPLGAMVTPAYNEQMPEAERIGWTQKVGREIGRIAVEAITERAERFGADRIDFKRMEILFPLENQMLALVKNLGIFKREAVGESIRSEVGLLRVGPMVMALTPGELSPAVGFDVKNLLKGRYRCVTCLANDEIGYVLDPGHFRDKAYHYEQSMSLGPQTGGIISEAVCSLLGS